MSGIASINSSLTSSLLSSLLSSASAPSAGISSDPTGTAADIVSLLGGSSSSSGSSLYSALTGSSGSTSTDSMYNILLSAESASMMKSDPALVDEITAAEQKSAAAGSSSTPTSTESLVNQLQNINLLTISPDTLLSIIEGFASAGTPTVNTTV
jgi:hypothetical protein